MKVSRLIFPVFLLITLITYYPTIGAGFVYDFAGWQRVYNLGNFSDLKIELVWYCDFHFPAVPLYKMPGSRP